MALSFLSRIPHWQKCCHACFLIDCVPRLHLCGDFSSSVRSFATVARFKNFAGKNDDISTLYVPVPVKPSNNPDDINVGEEISGKLKKDGLLEILNRFYRRPHLKEIALENGLDERLFLQAFNSFRRFCTEVDALPVDLHVTCSDIMQDAGHVDDLLPFFLKHARQVFPHLECIDDLKKISDLRLPANWYPKARAINRKIIFHAGPTNSGKTYHALNRFIVAKSGVYCGPLKMLATEVFGKTNAKGTACDLVTGEERRYALPDRSAASHVACTVEMTSVTMPYEVAIIDEIQMMRDQARGWAWTRALLGVAADEVHVCGEAAAIDLVKMLCTQVGETVEVRKYKRLTKLVVEDAALESLANVQPGDCVVCFSKNDIYHVSRSLEKLNREVAVIYGGLPPGAKLAQANKFNNPDDSCKILVATDAIGMGINLSIRRIIFYSLIKPVINQKGEKEMDTICTSQALQIAGRAGRYGTQHSEGLVTTFKREDLVTLKWLLSQTVKPIEAAGLHPTADQIELFAYHLPHATLSNLMDIFVSLSAIDDANYFICNVDDFKFLADMIQHVPLPLRARYVFCCSPINRKMPFVCTMFLKFTRQYCRNEPITFDWLCHCINWPFKLPSNIVELVHLEAVFDVLDLYLWLSYRFQDLFPDAELVRDMQKELDEIILLGVANITKLLKASDSGAVPKVDEDAFTVKMKSDSYNKDKPFVIEKGSSRIAFENDELKISKDESLYKAYPEEGLRRSFENGKGRVFGQGKLAEKLISKGLLTQEQLQELHDEWNRVKSKGDPSKK